MHRKPLAALAASAIALAVAGIALAHGGGPSSIQSASATFDAATVSDLKSDTCTGADGSYMRTKATYSGNATSADPRLNGPLTVRAKTVYNTDTNLGVVEGHFRVETASGHTDGKFKAVDTSGSLAGFADGRANDPKAKLLANFSATFDPSTGFSGGELGSGSSDDSAVFVSGKCGGEDDSESEHAHAPKHEKAKHEKHGKHGKHGNHGKKH
jgi:hypothetical protein